MLLISKNIKGLMHNYMASTNCFSAILIKYLNTLTFYHVSLIFLYLPFPPPKSRRSCLTKQASKEQNQCMWKCFPHGWCVFLYSGYLSKVCFSFTCTRACMFTVDPVQPVDMYGVQGKLPRMVVLAKFFLSLVFFSSIHRCF